MQELLKPLENNAVGEDPRYGDDFYIIRQELEKLTDINYEDIEVRCKNILLNQAKDIRIAGYLLLATAYVSGISALINALEVYRLLIKNYWEAIYPQREDARVQALAWLNNDRLLMCVQECDYSRNELEALKLAIEDFNACVRQYAADMPLFTILNVWLEDVLNKQQSYHEKPKEQEVVENFIPADQVTRVINYYLQEKQYAQAIAHARALRWSALTLPPHENYKTRIPAPRAIGVSQLESILTSNDHENILQQCEGLFLEPGGHVLLDLQFYAYNAALAMDENIAAIIQLEVAGLLERMPLLSELQFADQKPFANSATKEWLESMRHKDEISQVSAATISINDIIKEAKLETKSRKLIDWLNYLKQKPAANGQEKFYQNYAIASLCLENKRADLAMPLLEKLVQQINHHDLISWEQSLAISVLQDLYKSLTQGLKKAHEQIKSQRLQRIDEIYQLISQIDPVAAAALNY